MFKLIYNIFTSPFFKVFFKIIASLASAIAVISGYLFFVNRNIVKSRQDDPELDAKDVESEDDPLEPGPEMDEN